MSAFTRSKKVAHGHPTLSFLDYVSFFLYFVLTSSAVGHSLGGALASLVALRLRIEGIVPASVLVYTLGQPRVGEQNFVECVVVPFLFYEFGMLKNL